jgi:uncharacterized protein YndB with AHSA1/START domain
MTGINDTRARAVADLAEGLVLASVDVAAAPERVFQALASKEITEWWVRPGVFDTREWTGDVRGWSLASVGHDEVSRMQEGSSSRWNRRDGRTRGAGEPGVASTVTYLLEPTDGKRAALAPRVRLARHVQRVRDRMGNEPETACRNPRSQFR